MVTLTPESMKTVVIVLCHRIKQIFGIAYVRYCMYVKLKIDIQKASKVSTRCVVY